MTKHEMTTLLRSVGCDENTVTAMENAYEMGFEQGATVTEVLKRLVEEAESVCNSVDSDLRPNTDKFWALFDRVRDMV
jgi:hypothetical protein